MQVCKVSVLNTYNHHFDYQIPETSPPIGARVLVPFGKRELIGIVIDYAKVEKSGIILKEIIQQLDLVALISDEILYLCKWISNYYQSPLSEVLALAMPKRYRLGKDTTISQKKYAKLAEIKSHPRENNLNLNAEQEIAVTKITQSLNKYYCFLLYGVTGSGKTEVYLQTIQHVLKQGKQILILVPEIGLTPQLVARFKDRFETPILTMHSSLNDTERQIAWQAAANNQIQILIGTRSAIFTPMPNLGLIVLDEEHDTSFKQMDGVRYSARDVSLMRAYNAKIPIILGSATPSLEALHNVQTNKYYLLRLQHKALNKAPLNFNVIDLRNQNIPNGVSAPALNLIKQHLKQGSQVLVFINRRGFAPVLLCHQCGWMADCKNCDSHLTLHSKNLICHHCCAVHAKYYQCLKCKSRDLLPIGSGTQRIFDYLSSEFPAINMLRIDRDETLKKNSLANHLLKITNEEVQLIVGTQMLAKGHHFPKLSLVIILDADQGLYNQDFRALEKLGQLITQVAGRAGRANLAGTIAIQTHQPQHPLLNVLIQKGYDEFANELLNQRKEANLPPYSFMSILRACSKNQTKLTDFLLHLKNNIANIKTFGPAPSPLARKANEYQMQLLMQSDSRQLLNLELKKLQKIKIPSGIKLSIDVDPIDFA